MGRGRIQARSQADRSGKRSGARNHPIAPTELPRVWSTAQRRAARGGRGGTAVCTPREGDTPPRPRRQGRRIPGGADPRESGEILSQRPTTHRPQHHRTAKPFGFLLSRAHSHDPPWGRRGCGAATSGLRRGWRALWPLSRRSKTAQGRNRNGREGDHLDGRTRGTRGRVGYPLGVDGQRGAGAPHRLPGAPLVKGVT